MQDIIFPCRKGPNINNLYYETNTFSKIALRDKNGVLISFRYTQAKKKSPFAFLQI